MWKVIKLSKLQIANRVEVWDLGTIAFLGKLVAQGTSKLVLLTEDVPMPGVGVLPALNNHAEVDATKRWGIKSVSGCGIMVQLTRVVRSVYSR